MVGLTVDEWPAPRQNVHHPRNLGMSQRYHDNTITPPETGFGHLSKAAKPPLSKAAKAPWVDEALHQTLG